MMIIIYYFTTAARNIWFGDTKTPRRPLFKDNKGQRKARRLSAWDIIIDMIFRSLRKTKPTHLVDIFEPRLPTPAPN